MKPFVKGTWLMALDSGQHLGNPRSIARLLLNTEKTMVKKKKVEIKLEFA